MASYVYFKMLHQRYVLRVPLIDFCVMLERPVRETLFYPREYRLRGWAHRCPAQWVARDLSAEFAVANGQRDKVAESLGQRMFRFEVIRHRLVILCFPLSGGQFDGVRSAPILPTTLRDNGFRQDPTLYLRLWSMNRDCAYLLGLESEWVERHKRMLRRLDPQPSTNLGYLPYTIQPKSSRGDKEAVSDVVAAPACKTRLARTAVVWLSIDAQHVFFVIDGEPLYGVSLEVFTALMDRVHWMDSRFAMAQAIRAHITHRQECFNGKEDPKENGG